MTLYAWDEKDPMLAAWRSVFPGLVQPRASMPNSIRAHVRYPQDLFKVQRTLLGTYHVNNPITFYNVQRKWTVPQDNTDSTSATGSQPPYYVLAAPADGSSNRPQFQLTSAMNVNGRTLLAAYISADSDPKNYGKLTVLQVPPGENERPRTRADLQQMTSNQTVNRDSLYTTNGANVIHGNLLTLPLDKSFLYVEPLYRATTTSGSYPSL